MEDNAADARLVDEMLRDAGQRASASVARTLAEAIDRAAREPPDVVLLDLSLPDGAGIETFRRARDGIPGVPIIIMTGLSDEEVAIGAVQGGAQDYLVKGRVDGTLLARAIRYAIERHGLVARLEQAADRLRQSEAGFRNLARNADGILVVSEGGDVFFTNPAAQDLLGGCPVAFRTAALAAAARGASTRELQFVRPDGVEGVAEMRVVEIQWGDRPAFLASVRDVTERREAEEALRLQKDLYETLLRAQSDAGEGLVIFGDDGVRYANDAAAHIVDATPEALTALPSFEAVVAPDDRERFGRHAKDVARSVTRGPFDGAVLGAGGSRIEVEITMQPLRRSGRTDVLAIVRDVTEKRRLEREAEFQREAVVRSERLAALGTLVAGVAHEVNNPLTYLQGNLELADLELANVEAAARERRPPDPDAVASFRHGVRQALSGAERIARIVKTLKVVAREGRHVREIVDLTEVARSVEGLLRVGLPDRVALAVDAGPGPVVTIGDPSEIHQVVLNIAKNAVEAVGSRAGTVRVRVARRGGHAEVAIEDDGPGIPADARAKLFTPFFTTKPEGTGLGLSIVLAITRDHGGDVLVDSEPGRGSRFLVRLPAADDATAPGPPIVADVAAADAGQ